MNPKLYHYKATVQRIIDGDTVVLNIDLGFTISWKSSCRLYGINAEELSSKDPVLKAKALEAKQYLIDVLPIGVEVFVVSRELDKYGRPLVDIYFASDFTDHLNQELLNKQLVKSYLP